MSLYMLNFSDIGIYCLSLTQALIISQLLNIVFIELMFDSSIICSALIAKLAPESTMSGNDEGIESKGYKSTCPKVGWVRAAWTCGLKETGSDDADEVEK